MVHITYYHASDIFIGAQPENGLKPSFQNVKYEFDGFEFGNYLPTIRVDYPEFERIKNKLPTRRMVRIRTTPNIMQSLVYGVNGVDNKREDLIEEAKREYEANKQTS